MAVEARHLGAKVRALRRKERMTQRQLAERLDVSASYLNLIEHDRRPLSANLLIKLAQVFKLDLASFAKEGDDRLTSDLLETFSDPMFDRDGLTAADLRDLAATAPNVAQAALRLYRTFRRARESADSLTSQVSETMELAGESSHLPTEEVSDLIQRHLNHFPELEIGAERVWRDGRLDRNDLYRGLVRYLESALGVAVRVATVGTMPDAVRRYIPERRVLMLSEVLAPRSRNFQLAHQIGLLIQRPDFEKVAQDVLLTTEESRRLCHVALANYFAGAVLMPYETFLESARAERYDIELLGHRFRSGFEQVCHRLTSLRRQGAEGVPFHLLRLDIAGNISKKFSASGIRFARFSGVCPRWGVFEAFLTPGMIRSQLFQMPDGKTYFSISRTLPKGRPGYRAPYTHHAITIGCEVGHARHLVYADGMNLDHLETAVPTGVTCRLCERIDCEQRAVPPLFQPLKVDENVRGLSFYVPARELRPVPPDYTPRGE